MSATQRLESFIRKRRATRPLLVMAHAVVGYPSLEANREMLQRMDQAGVDIVELQLPFSEPIADGPLFVKANQEAIAAGTRWDDYFALLEEAAGKHAFAILFMGYYNSVFRMGHEAFTARLAKTGGKGYIIADLPPEESSALNQAGRAQGLDPVLLMTPTNSSRRLEEIAKQASGLVYCVARKGVTGRHTDVSAGVPSLIARCRAATGLPLAVGFGIKTADDVRSLRGLADAAIVGTACLEAWESLGPEGYSRFLESLTTAAHLKEGLPLA